MGKVQKNKKILFAISGGIAAYKAPEVLRSFIKQGCNVEVVLTKAAESFVSTLVLGTLSGKKVWREDDFLSTETGRLIPHISLADWADVIVVAPCTANVLRIAAQGDSSTLIGALLLACRKPVVLFPAMNSNMLEHPATKQNIEHCKGLGYIVVDPDEGLLACGVEGKGRLPDAEIIMENVWRALCANKDYNGKHVIVTAGPTHEYIDPVRFVSNPSSGKMGYALAYEAWRRGANVTLISGPTTLSCIPQIAKIDVTTAEEMYNACMEKSTDADVIIKAAAVGDFKAAELSDKKIKREGKGSFNVNFTQNKDIAAELGRIKKTGQVLVGFAAETDDLVENGAKKIAAKNLDFIAVNDVLKVGAGFGCDTNSVTIIAADGTQIEATGSKEEVAEAILDAVAKKMA